MQIAARKHALFYEGGPDSPTMLDITAKHLNL